MYITSEETSIFWTRKAWMREWSWLDLLPIYSALSRIPVATTFIWKLWTLPGSQRSTLLTIHPSTLPLTHPYIYPQLIHLPIHHVSTHFLSHPSTDPPIYLSICLYIHPSSHQIFLESYHWLRTILDTGDMAVNQKSLALGEPMF